MELDQAALAHAHKGTMAELMGIEFRELGPDRVVAELRIRAAVER